MARKLTFSLTLTFAAGVAFAADPGSVQIGGSDGAPRLDYVGSATRIGLGIDIDGSLAGELLQVLDENADTALIGEAWFSDGAGGLKLNYHWLNTPGDGIYKLFGAIDQNDEQDRKVSLGFGYEDSDLFYSGHLSAAVTDERLLGRSTRVSERDLFGSDEIGDWVQTETTTSVTSRFEHPYDYGVGLRVGEYFDESLVRLSGGVDYEWGDYGSYQYTFSMSLEKFIAGTGHSIALSAEAMHRDGDFETDTSDARVMLMWRFSPGNDYRPQAPRRAAVPAAAADAAAASAAMGEPRFRVVMNEVEMNADMFFGLDSARLLGEGSDELRVVAERIKAGTLVGKVSVVGHTCSLGPEVYNQALSERRANAVRDKLVELGVPADALLAVGRGESQPRHSNASEETRRLNRRVDLHMIMAQESREQLPAAEQPAAERSVEWTQTPIEAPAWLRRALVNPAQHKRHVDVYRYEKVSETVSLGEREYLNRVPTAAADSASLNRNGEPVLIDVLANDSDPDGDSLTIAAVTQPNGGSVENFGDFVRFTPSSGFYGQTEFEYTVADGNGGEATARVSVSVNNRAPIAADDQAVSRSEPVSIDVLANDVDPDGDPLSLAGVGAAAHGQVSVQGDRVIYTPESGYVGDDSFSYEVQDDGGASATATVTVTVSTPNSPPDARDDTLVTRIKPLISVSVLANDWDPDGDELTVVSLANLPEGIGAFSIGGGKTVEFRPEGWGGETFSFTYTISDGHGGSDSATVTIIDP